ncbi:MAG: type II toxin-antitoxin system RatA family toxin [Gammaproteobacteria bacterium]
MPSISRNAIVPYTAAQMFALVNAVEDYPRFLPWCSSSQVHSRNEDEVKASIEMSKGAVRKSFTTLNRLQQDKIIEIRLLDGPFDHLEGIWRFENLPNGGSRVSLDMEFKFAGRMISMLFGPIFHQIANMLVDSFCKQADKIYR